MMNSTYDLEKKKATLETQLVRIEELYQWGHKTKEKYFVEYAALQREIQLATTTEPKVDILEKLAKFLKDIVLAWQQASQEQRNRLASALMTPAHRPIYILFFLANSSKFTIFCG